MAQRLQTLIFLATYRGNIFTKRTVFRNVENALAS